MSFFGMTLSANRNPHRFHKDLRVVDRDQDSPKSLIGGKKAELSNKAGEGYLLLESTRDG